ncbi:pirin family protein [Streptomyces sp. NBC_00669]|uniref:pirin family protein n=1 Tax=unclassified Streptomyces TaxID=2593676 RepID=UPI002E3009A4|nr:pirin family protein [Streptomyces sp. NBC_00669]
MTAAGEVWRAERRYTGGDPSAGIETRHAFSFAGFYDPANVRFGLLLACNEERLAPGAGFAEHTHRDTEIVTWVIEGELEHRDTEGVATRLRAGDAQLLSAGGGVRHVERNPGADPCRFLQMWLHPDPAGGPSRHSVATDVAPPGPGPYLLASAAPDAPLPLRQPHAALHLARGSGPLPDAPFLYLHVLRGTVRVDGRELGPGDALRAANSRARQAEAPPDAEYLVWRMTAEPSYG